MTRAYAANPTAHLKIEDAFIDMRTGPGQAYPVIQVVERGDWIEVLKSRTDWYKIKTQQGRTGWVNRAHLKTTLTRAGGHPQLSEFDHEDFSTHQWAISGLGGTFEGANVMTLTGGWFPSRNLGFELSGSHILDQFSSSQMVDVALVSRPFPNWWVSPFLQIGTGMIHTDPKVTLVSSRDKTDLIGHVGIGAQIHIDQRFVFRVQFKRHTIFQSIDDNQEINEWKAGFSVFF